MDSQDPLLLHPPTINPYKSAVSLIRNRLRWDMHPQSWSSRKRLKMIHDKYRGQKAVILCNGPSLNRVDFDLLRTGCFTFGLNKINLLFDRTSFRPDCITAVNPFVIEQNQDFFNQTDLPLFLDSIAITNRWIRPNPERIFLHNSSSAGFAKDCSVSINQGYTVTYVAMQLAYHMGFSSVALVGCDHNFATTGPANKTVISGDKDESHFDPNYFSGGVKWQLPDLFESEVHYGRAKRVFEAHGRSIVNCTDGGNLEIFQRIPLGDFLGIE